MDEYQINRFISTLKSYFKKSYGYSLSYFSDWLYEALKYNEPDVAALFEDQAELAAAVLELDDLYDVYFSEFGFYSKTYIITVKGRSKINMYKDLNIEDDDISYTEFATGIHKVDADGELKENLILPMKLLLTEANVISSKILSKSQLASIIFRKSVLATLSAKYNSEIPNFNPDDFKLPVTDNICNNFSLVSNDFGSGVTNQKNYSDILHHQFIIHANGELDDVVTNLLSKVNKFISTKDNSKLYNEIRKAIVDPNYFDSDDFRYAEKNYEAVADISKIKDNIQKFTQTFMVEYDKYVSLMNRYAKNQPDNKNIVLSDSSFDIIKIREYIIRDYWNNIGKANNYDFKQLVLEYMCFANLIANIYDLNNYINFKKVKYTDDKNIEHDGIVLYNKYKHDDSDEKELSKLYDLKTGEEVSGTIVTESLLKEEKISNRKILGLPNKYYAIEYIDDIFQNNIDVKNYKSNIEEIAAAPEIGYKIIGAIKRQKEEFSHTNMVYCGIVIEKDGKYIAIPVDVTNGATDGSFSNIYSVIINLSKDYVDDMISCVISHPNLSSFAIKNIKKLNIFKADTSAEKSLFFFYINYNIFALTNNLNDENFFFYNPILEGYSLFNKVIEFYSKSHVLKSIMLNKFESYYFIYYMIYNDTVCNELINNIDDKKLVNKIKKIHSDFVDYLD